MFQFGGVNTWRVFKKGMPNLVSWWHTKSTPQYLMIMDKKNSCYVEVYTHFLKFNILEKLRHILKQNR